MQTKINLNISTDGGPIISGDKTITHAGENKMDFTVPGGSTHLDFLFASDATNRVGYLFSSDQDVTVKVNSSSEPNATLALTANSPDVSSVAAASSPITVDIVTLFFTNAGSDSATVKVRTFQNAVEP